jgi:ABC-type enterochelin transport system permease subunit
MANQKNQQQLVSDAFSADSMIQTLNMAHTIAQLIAHATSLHAATLIQQHTKNKLTHTAMLNTYAAASMGMKRRQLVC